MAAKRKAFLLDMDGVLVHGRRPIPGAPEFIGRLLATQTRFLVITNNPMYTPRDLSHRLATEGMNIPEQNLFTSALATAQFLSSQRPNGTAFVIGDTGLTHAMHQVGYTLTNKDPEYVVLGESNSFSLGQITQAIRLVQAGARFIATNPDPTGPSETGIVPACGAMAALIERATGVRPYFIGKPNPLMMRRALLALGTHSEETIMVGDRMDTDVVTGMEAGMETILVLSGVTRREDVAQFPYQPTRILPSVAEIDVS
ncbi:MAG: HAD family hydrolase [Zavarzinella sp.]|nr:HAD family hydrolase [Zavarzinella sp.]